MTVTENAESNRKKETSLEEALEIVGDGIYTNFVAFVCGLLTLSCIASVQCMYNVLPAVGCELRLDEAQKGFLASTTFFGTMLSAVWFGFLIDYLGRRRILLFTTAGSSLTTVIMSFAPNAPTLMFFAFCTGCMLGGILGIPFVFLSEFCPNKIISRKMIFVAVVSSLANTFSPCAAWLVDWFDIHARINDSFSFTSWRLYLIVNTLPMALSTILLFQIPESPKFLLAKGRPLEALESLRRLFAKNQKKSKNSFPVVLLIPDLDDVNSLSDKIGFLNIIIIMAKQIKEVFTPPLVKYTLMCASMQVAVMGIYSIVYMWVPDETQKMLMYYGNSKTSYATLCDVMSSAQQSSRSKGKCHTEPVTYLVSITVGLVYFVLSLILIYVVRKVRLKIILGYNILISAALCVIMQLFRSIYLILTSLGLMVSILSAIQPAVYGIIVQSFPTYLRATATTVTLVFARITVTVGSALFGAAFQHSYCNLAYSIVAAVLTGISVISFLTPNKRNSTQK